MLKKGVGAFSEGVAVLRGVVAVPVSLWRGTVGLY